MTYEERLAELADYKFWDTPIPERMHGGIARYIKNHVTAGDFLMAVFRNDLREAVMRADDENRYLLNVYVGYLYNEAPNACWGSREKVQAWLEMKP